METKKILLADPSESVRKIIVNAFEEESFELVTADDFDSSIKKFTADEPSLVLAGISLLGRDGYALCEYVKGVDPLIPVVMLVGTDETLNSEEALRVGADDYFIRPFKSQDLVEKISDLLANYARNASVVPNDIAASAHAPSVDVDEPAMINVNEPAMGQVHESASYGEVPSELPSDVSDREASSLEDHEVDISLDENKSSDINESSEAFLAEMGIDEGDGNMDIDFGNIESAEEPSLDSLNLDDEEGEDILEEFLSDIDVAEMGEPQIGDIIIGETKTGEIENNEALTEEKEVYEVQTNEAVVEEFLNNESEIEEVVTDEIEEEVAQINKVAANEATAEEISFNDDAIIEESDIAGEVPGVVASIDEKGVAVEGIVEISKSKIEELILNNTKEDVKNIAYELVPGLAKEPIARIVPEAVEKVSTRLIGEIAKEVTAQVAEGIIEKIAAEITSEKAAEHIAAIAGEAVVKAAEARIQEIASEAAENAANKIISGLAEKTAIDAAEKLITGEIKSFKSKLSKEG